MEFPAPISRLLERRWCGGHPTKRDLHTVALANVYLRAHSSSKKSSGSLGPGSAGPASTGLGIAAFGGSCDAYSLDARICIGYLEQAWEHTKRVPVNRIGSDGRELEVRAAGAAFDPADFMAYTVLAKYRASQAASDSVVLAPLLPYFGDQAVQAEAAALAEAKAKADEAIAESFSPLSRWSSIPHHPCRSSGSGSLSSEPPPWTLAPWTWRARIFASEHELSI